MITKRGLKRLEALLSLMFLANTVSRQKTACILGISVDTLAHYISFLESDLKIEVFQRQHSCSLSEKAKNIVTTVAAFFDLNYGKIHIPINLKNLRSLFYLNAVFLYGNKRKASQKLSASVETINLYIENLENIIGKSLILTNNKGSFLTPVGEHLIKKFNMLINEVEHLYKTLAAAKIKKIRLALSREIDAAILLESQSDILQDIMTFADDPNMHAEDWDIAITYSEPTDDDLVIITKKEIACGFFASKEYLNSCGMPQNLDDLVSNHRILDGSSRPYADKAYKTILQKCRKICPINSINIIITDMAGYGAGICVVPITVAKNNLIYLQNIPCSAKATLYLSVHKSIKDLPLYQTAISKYCEILKAI